VIEQSRGPRLDDEARALSSRPRAVVMVATFLWVFLLFTLCEYAFRQQVGPFVNGVMTVRPAARLVDLVAPSEHVRARGDRIESPAAFVRVAQGCEGVDVMLMFIAGMLAVRTSWKRTLVGSIVGGFVLYLSNLARVAGLWLCVRFWPSRFEAMHVIVGQTAIIVIAVLLLAASTRGVVPMARPAEAR
jgi:exosortase/archaeosortase family protein